MAVIMNDPAVRVISLRDGAAWSNVKITPQKPPNDIRCPARAANHTACADLRLEAEAAFVAYFRGA